MKDMIEVQPSPALRQEFARWAVAQDPKIRTVSPASFAVPSQLFTEAPERILVGALVDGHRYVSPEEDAAAARPAAGGQSTQLEAVPGDALPPVPASAYGPDSVPLEPAPAAEPTEPPQPTAELDGADQTDRPEGVFPCSGCDREFTTARGRDAHARRAHEES